MVMVSEGMVDDSVPLRTGGRVGRISVTVVEGMIPVPGNKDVIGSKIPVSWGVELADVEEPVSDGNRVIVGRISIGSNGVCEGV